MSRTPNQDVRTSNEHDSYGSADLPRTARILHGDALALLRTFPDSTFDAVLTDPPYAISKPKAAVVASTPEVVSGKTACRQEDPTCNQEGCRAHDVDREIALFAESRMLGQQSANWHEKATHSRGYADNDPTTFHRWCSLWTTECLRVLKPGGHLVAFGGTRTWHRLATAAEEAGFEIRDSLVWLYGTGFPKSLDLTAALERNVSRDQPTRSALDATHWQGWGTALKPAQEPIVLARKPLAGTVASNVLAHGTGALNIDACRIDPGPTPGAQPPAQPSRGRWPTNVFLDPSQAAVLDRMSHPNSASRFFWVAKPSTAERVTVAGVAHPTVKPVTLMRELVRLVTPVGGTVLDPFAGSGTTVEACLLEGVSCVAIERDAQYLPLIGVRVERALGQASTDPGTPAAPAPLTLFDLDDLAG